MKFPLGYISSLETSYCMFTTFQHSNFKASKATDPCRFAARFEHASHATFDVVWSSRGVNFRKEHKKIKYGDKDVSAGKQQHRAGLNCIVCWSESSKSKSVVDNPMFNSCSFMMRDFAPIPKLILCSNNSLVWTSCLAIKSLPSTDLENIKSMFSFEVPAH